MTALLGSVANASANNITFSKNFATERLNIESPYFDLSHFGYYGGQLPKVYGLNQSTSGVEYLPGESFNEFQKIISGTNNASTDFLAQQESLWSSMKRSTTNSISMLLRNAAGEGNAYAIAADHTVCHTGSAAPWHYVVVYWIKEAYITFWKSDRCNGHKGSFNPVCNYYDDPSEVCIFNFKPQSFRVYSGCHHSDGWGGGCSEHAL
ncbi:hypothetical protein BO78DRAFT_406612 [Aspergillus sclerotiicarbonarius CBS 121057]|uniref:Uncharacterized protein n=1 Tax=Aspergillus sclerotiicarbonarius (strain CBS 121057 / IBT 28362) TaxID=1448318 RepID=A0A319ETN4_ASPSB|nr:hypothetical protein BO78DRAFT_406612 [Aspergillus sclerotiicarbonarius CBS 121057]